MRDGESDRSLDRSKQAFTRLCWQKALHDIHSFAIRLVFTSLAFGKRIPCMWVLFVQVCIFNQVIDCLSFGGGTQSWPQYWEWTGKTDKFDKFLSGFHMITDEVDKGKLLLDVICLRYRFMSNFHSHFLLVPTKDWIWLTNKLADRLQRFSRLLCPSDKTEEHYFLAVIEGLR